MAEGQDGRWPGVTTRDEGKYFVLFLKVREMKVKSSWGNKKPSNADIRLERNEREYISVHIQINDGSKYLYKYCKKLPKPIIPDGTKYEAYKEGIVRLTLKKENAKESWDSPVIRDMEKKEAEET